MTENRRWLTPQPVKSAPMTCSGISPDEIVPIAILLATRRTAGIGFRVMHCEKDIDKFALLCDINER
jgi:hypothetical protein